MRLDIQKFADGKVVIETKLDTSGFEDGIDDMENSSKISKFIEAMKSKFTEIGQSFSDAIKKAGPSIKKIAKAIKEVGAIALKTIAKVIASAIGIGVALMTALGVVALIGVAFVSLIQAIDKVKQEHTELTAQIQYIIYAIKSMLTPLIEWLANAIAKIIQTAVNGILYVIALISALTGRKMPTAQEFADNMKNAEKSSKGTAKNAKEIKKQLAGFDEMNVIQDNRGGAGGIGGATEFNFDIPTLDEQIAHIQQKVKDFVDRTKKSFIELREANTYENRMMILESDRTWGLLELGAFDATQGIIGIFTGLYHTLEGIGKIIVGVFTLDWTKIKEGAMEAYTGIRETFNGLKQFFIGISEIIAGAIFGVFNSIINYLTPFANTIINTFNTMVGKVNTAFTNLRNGINNIIGNIKTFLTNTFGDFGTAVGNLIGDRIKTIINGVLALAETMLNKPINAINSAITTLNKITGGKISKLSTLKFPRLAKGGIINMPGRGTLVGSAIAGESGREAVLPLTDSQQMELLGEAIGRYITINANITNTMNGRIISRELQKINNENSFAGNR